MYCQSAPPLGNRNQIIPGSSASELNVDSESLSNHAGQTDKNESADFSLPTLSISENQRNKAPRVHPVFTLPEEYTEEGRKTLVEKLTSGSLNVQDAYPLAVRLITPVTVHIETTSVQRPGALSVRPAKELNNEAGAGFIVFRQGKYYVLTNGHVIHASENTDSPDNVYIYLSDGRMVHPVRIISDPLTDIAVMEIAGQYWGVELGNSDAASPGDMVLAAGSPFGLRNSFSRGIISAKGRRHLEVGKTSLELQDFIQTDAAIHPGNSGGPLINLRGEVIGMNSAIASNSGFGEGVSFAIPIKQVESVADQLIMSGKVERGWLGARLDDNFTAAEAAKSGVYAALFTNRPTPIYPPRTGARILSAPVNTPAGQSGLQSGDIVLYYDGVVVEDKDHLTYLVRLSRPGKRVKIVFFRNGKLFEHSIVAGRFIPGVSVN